jgi:hypothetical protein
LHLADTLVSDMVLPVTRTHAIPPGIVPVI